MKWRILFVLTTLMLSAKLFAADNQKVSSGEILPPSPAREFRGVWITEVATNPDWPSKPGLTTAEQKNEMLALLDRAAQLHFNAVFFQVRPACDAFYASFIEPWSDRLTGTQGRAPEPFYDPLAFTIAEAHKRGLELHAWFNPFRAAHPGTKPPIAPNQITRTHPGIIRHYDGQIWLDPGEPESQSRTLAVVLDVVKRYDVDGIVFDDYFYPYPAKNWAGRELDFPDDASWQKFGLKTGLTRGDWRRDNVNQLVQKISQGIKAAKPWVQFGISPFGIWRPQNPPQIKGLDAYAKIYADSRKWLANGWVDYFAPQLYWPIADREHSFPALFDWWRAQNFKGRHLWPALYNAMVGTKFSTEEIPRQVQITRGKSDPGAIHYHLRSVLDNPALAAVVRSQYSQPVLIPATPWLDSTPPEKPKLTVNDAKNSLNVRWENAGTEPARWWLFQSRTNAVSTTEIFPANQTSRVLENSSPDAISIRAVDRLGNLSAPTFWSPKKYSPGVSSKGAV